MSYMDRATAKGGFLCQVEAYFLLKGTRRDNCVQSGSKLAEKPQKLGVKCNSESTVLSTRTWGTSGESLKLNHLNIALDAAREGNLPFICKWEGFRSEVCTYLGS